MAGNSDLILNLLMQNQLLENMLTSCEAINIHLSAFSVTHSLELNNLIATNPLMYNPIVADWSIDNTIEFREQLQLPITDNLIRDRLVVENLLWIHVITGNLMTSNEHFGETLMETYLLNKKLITMYKITL